MCFEILTQPLLTEEGFLNEACMRELEAAIRNMPETYERLKNEPEWTIKTWTGASEIVGQLSHWAIRLFNKIPLNLVEITGYTLVEINNDSRFNDWEDLGKYAQLSLCEINKLLWDILGDLKQFNDWNDSKIMRNNWIDLSALLHNVCISIRDQRRHDVAFDTKFEREHKDGHI